ncbi:MAG: FHA domain-containing protein [Mycobacterium sp.]|nr:FHA domain-containing protein [Mycobacterium sp.]
MPICIDGHTSVADDYCDVCGAAMEEPAKEVEACPACGATVTGRFCETCGNDSALPGPAAVAGPEPQGVVWTAVVDADPEFYQRTLAQGGPDSVEFPQVFPERRIILSRSNTLIGRRNREQGVVPDIDLSIHPVDRGVSTQHAVLRVKNSGLTITDLGSTNGTSLNGSDSLLKMDEEVALHDGDRIHVGAWTTITVHRSRP